MISQELGLYSYLSLFSTAVEPWPENAALYQPLKSEQVLLSDNASCLAVQAFLKMCNLPVQVVCRANAEYMSPSGKVPFIHVGNQVISELGPIVQFVKAKGHSLSDGLDEVQRAEMKAYMELVNNMLLTAELYIQWCDEATLEEITQPRYSFPYSWPLNYFLVFQRKWEIKRKMKAIGWATKTLEQVFEDVDQCCQALSQRLGTQPYFFNKHQQECATNTIICMEKECMHVEQGGLGVVSSVLAYSHYEINRSHVLVSRCDKEGRPFNPSTHCRTILG
uniref:Metaxin 2 n=1 Tax=Xenopus tropicalis TaxID=8364 RepID=A0A803JBL6_XENTR